MSSSIVQIVNVSATLDPDEVEGMTRYQFTLYGKDGESSREFIVDVPDDDNSTCDVWVQNSTVQVGDTPADGFATFTPEWVTRGGTCDFCDGDHSTPDHP